MKHVQFCKACRIKSGVLSFSGILVSCYIIGCRESYSIKQTTFRCWMLVSTNAFSLSHAGIILRRALRSLERLFFGKFYFFYKWSLRRDSRTLSGQQPFSRRITNTNVPVNFQKLWSETFSMLCSNDIFFPCLGILSLKNILFNNLSTKWFII